MSRGYTDRKKFIKDVDRDLRGVKAHRIERRDFPDLKPGEFIYYVKNRSTGELKHVVATTRERAEDLAFPKVAQNLLRSMPVKGYKESYKSKPKEEDNGRTE